MNNLHQIGIATDTYTLDWDSHLPWFRTWLATTSADLTTGTLYPYLKSKPVYLCPSDNLSGSPDYTLSPTGPVPVGPIPVPIGPSPVPRGAATAPRNYSYAMSCGYCHAVNPADFREPHNTLLYMEANLATNDYSGLVGPGGWLSVAHSLAFNHNHRGHLLMADFHVETMDANQFTNAAQMKRFWFPNDDSGGMQFPNLQ